MAGAEFWCSAKLAVDEVALPILRLAALDGCDDWSAHVAGSVVSLPGAPTQPSHTDGLGSEFVNAFVPLVDVTELNGPTEMAPGSQAQSHDASKMPSDPFAPLPGGVAPTLSTGDLLLFQYRVTHRGCANRSQSGRPVLATRKTAVTCRQAAGTRDAHPEASRATLPVGQPVS